MSLQYKIIKPWAKAELTSKQGINILKTIERRARVSHRSEDKVTEDSYDRLLRSVVLNHGDWSVVEHVSVTVKAEVDRGITHEWVRHRIGSYTQESTRFVNYDKPEHMPRFIVPQSIHDNTDSFKLWKHSIDCAVENYEQLLREGHRPQEARSVLPNALASRIDVTYNLRSWRHFFIMRTTRETHPQMKEVTIPLLREFQLKIPILYEDIVPFMSQSDAIKLGY